MEYKSIYKGEFLSRPNRFIAEVLVEGKPEFCHVKNTGGCRELLIKGAEVYLEKAENLERKTRYSLVAVKKGDSLFNIDSAAPNVIFGEWVRESGFFGCLSHIKSEKTYGASRFDYYLEGEGKKIFVEVKGVTLEDGGVLLFPDAPTERGVKHLQHLVEAKKEGYEAYVFFIAQTEIGEIFKPNRKMHPQFADALLKAKEEGVGVYCLSCTVTPSALKIKDFVPVQLSIH